MDVEGIADFITLAELRSFSKAAAARFVTQPAFSRRIKNLESQLEISLVDRAVTPVALTRAGERFLIYARNIADILDKAIDEAQSQTTVLDNPVNIVMPRSLSVTFFPSWYREMQRCVPGLHVSLSSESGSKSVQDLRNGLADIAIVMQAAGVKTCFDFDGLKSHIIGCDHLLAVCAPHARDKRHELLSYRSGSYMNDCAREVTMRNKALKKMRAVFESSSSDLLRAMALTGLGTAVLQESLIADDLDDGYLIPAFKIAKKLACDIIILRTPAKLSAKAEAVWMAAKQLSKK